jgi:hypothetical protein
VYRLVHTPEALDQLEALPAEVHVLMIQWIGRIIASETTSVSRTTARSAALIPDQHEPLLVIAHLHSLGIHLFLPASHHQAWTTWPSEQPSCVTY